MKINKIICLIVFFIIFCSFAINAQGNQKEIVQLITNFTDAFRNNNVQAIQTIIKNSEVEDNIINFLVKNQIQEFKTEVVEFEKSQDNKIKVLVKYDIDYRSKSGVIIGDIGKIKIYLQRINNKMYVIDSDLIQKIRKSSRIMLIYAIISFVIVVPYFLYIMLWRTDLSNKEKRFWAFVIAFLNIVGVALFHFKVNKKKEENDEEKKK